MKYRTLGSTKLRVGVIGMGTWQFGGEWGKDFSQGEVTEIFRAALETGVNLVDTAECYGDHTSERLIGGAIKELGARDKFIVATKFGHKFHANFKRTEPRTPADVSAQLEESLQALQSDYIDLYQYHSWGDADFASEEVRGVLEKAKAAGKIRHIGNSISQNFKTTVQVEQAPKFHVECLQVVYNRLQRNPEDTIFPIAERLKLGVLARVPLASGALAGTYKPGHRFPENDVRAQWMAGKVEEWLKEAERIEREELPAGMTMIQYALAWCLKSPAVQCVIPGVKSAEQLRNNASAGDLAMVDGHHPWAAK